MRDMRINLIIVETAGQERYRSIAMNFLKSAHGAILLYDITNISTFESLQKYYIKNIEEINPNIKYIIVGNNSDLENYRSISREEVRKYCEIKNVEEIEVSSKLNININECFEMLIKSILKNKTKEELINMYNDKKIDENYKILLEKEKKKKMKKKIFSKFDKCTIF